MNKKLFILQKKLFVFILNLDTVIVDYLQYNKLFNFLRINIARIKTSICFEHITSVFERRLREQKLFILRKNFLFFILNSDTVIVDYLYFLRTNIARIKTSICFEHKY